MRVMRSLAATAAIGLALAPFTTAAQTALPATGTTVLPEASGEITAGAGWQSNTSAYFGRYNGQPDHGFYGIGDIHLDAGSAWDSGGTNNLRVDADNLGFQTRSANIELGQQGSWGVRLYYQGIPYTYSTDFKSIWSDTFGLDVRPGSVKNVTTRRQPAAVGERPGAGSAINPLMSQQKALQVLARL